MSLINEALKRTRDASFPAGNSPPPTLQSYRVASRADSTLTGPRSTVWVTLVALVVALSGVAIFALRMITPTQQLNDALRKSPPPVVVKPAAPAPAIIALPAPVAPAAPALAPAAVPHEPTPPTLVLQGITSQGNQHEALINGYSVHEGEEIEGARVLAIESRRVRLEFAGKEIVLRMP